MPENHPRKWPRYVAVGLALVIVIAGLAGVKVKQIKQLIGFGQTMKAMGPPPETVGSTVAEGKTWESVISAVGSISGKQSVQVAAETSGTVTKLFFESGAVVKQGQVLVELDARTESAQLAALQSRATLAKTNMERTKHLLDVGAIARTELDNASNEVVAAESALEALRAQVGQKTIRAPFAGKTGIRAVNVGQYLAPGVMVTTLESLGGMFVDFSLPQDNLSLLAVGNAVRVGVRGDSTMFDGKITAVDPTIDPVTRNIKVRASIDEHGDKLRSGMYVTVQVVLPTQTNVVAVPQTAVIHATYGNSVFVIEDGKSPAGQPTKVARQQFVKLGVTRGDFVAVTNGLKAGQRVVSEGAFKLRNGAPILINDSVKPNAQLDPHPENR